MLRYSVFGPAEARRPEIAEDYKLFFLGRARSIESALADGREFLAAGKFTVVDICIGYAVMLAGTLGLHPEMGPLTLAWYEKLALREGFAAAKARQGG
jgi:glutathione S-transferase